MSENNTNTKRVSNGAIWKRTTRNNREMLSGQIEINGKKIEFIAFPNDFKQEDKHPDYKLYLTEDRAATQPQTKTPAPKPVKKQTTPVEVADDDDVAF